MKLRKFKIISIELDPSGAGPDRAWQITYTAIINKQWQTNKLWVIANNEKDARHTATSRFGGKE